MNKFQIKTFTGTSLLAAVLSLIGGPAWGFDLTINPPPSLTLDGMSISNGTFNLTGATGYYIDGGSILSEALGPLPDPINATIPSPDPTPHILLEDLDDQFEALNLTGFFDATNPDKPPAFFDITLFGIMGEGTGDFTYFLPATTGPLSFYQLTDLGPTTALGDNINTFSSAAPTFRIDPVSGKIVGDPGGTVIGTSNGNSCAPPGINFHGGGGGTPPPPCSVPEPSSLLGLLSLAVVGAGSMLKRKQDKTDAS